MSLDSTYVTIKNLSYAKITGANHLYLIIDKINASSIEKSNDNKYLTLPPYIILSHYIIMSLYLTLLPNMVILVRYVFIEGNKYYPEAFLHESLHKL